jgi:hypothetical protein
LPFNGGWYESLVKDNVEGAVEFLVFLVVAYVAFVTVASQVAKAQEDACFAAW